MPLLSNSKAMVLSQSQIWDLVIEKAFLIATEANPGVDLKSEELKKRKFNLILAEMKELIFSFKKLVETCLIPVDLIGEEEISLGPELSRALGKEPEICWKWSESFVVNSVTSLDPKNVPESEYFEEDVNGEADDLMLQISYLPLKFGVEFEEDGNETNFDDILDDVDDDIGDVDMEKVPDAANIKVDDDATIEDSGADSDLKKNQSKPIKRFRCTVCEKDFSSNAVLRKHARVHVGNKGGLGNSLQCDLCDYSTNAKNGLSLHKRSAHKVIVSKDNTNSTSESENYQLECQHCTRRYKNPKNLNRHQKSCTGVPPPAIKPSWLKSPLDGRYHCSFTGCLTKKTWTCSSGVWKHFNAEHADLKDESYSVYSCDMCERRFPTKAMYNQHRKQKHVNFFEFACNVCGKLLPSNERLRLHMRQHTGEKPYSCDLCDYKSITQSSVNQHKMRMHESGVVVPRHVCDICGKTFKVKSNLKEHIKSHSDVRTFLCGFCGKALKNRQCLNRHLFTHGVKYTCSCGKNFANQASLNVHKRDKHGDNV